jgi:uncharacterized protein
MKLLTTLSIAALLVLLAGCQKLSQPKDQVEDLGGGRYHVAVRGAPWMSVSTVEQYFHHRAADITKQAGYDSYRVVDQHTGWEPFLNARQPFSTGVVEGVGGRQGAARPSGAPGQRLGSGTGFLITADGVVLTNEHVVSRCGRVTVRRPDGAPAEAAVVVKDARNDLAVLRAASLASSSVAQFRARDDIRQGEPVVAVGYPLSGLLSSGTTLTTGTLSALAGPQNDTRLYQMSAPVQPGNSGGPLLDASGNVIGIVSAKLGVLPRPGGGVVVPENVNFAIKASIARAFLDGNSVAYRSGASATSLAPTDIGERANRFTLFVECYG